jgi:hypothetical protein
VTVRGSGRDRPRIGRGEFRQPPRWQETPQFPRNLLRFRPNRLSPVRIVVVTANHAHVERVKHWRARNQAYGRSRRNWRAVMAMPAVGGTVIREFPTGLT